MQALSQRINWQRYEDDHSLPSSTYVKEELTSTPLLTFMMYTGMALKTNPLYFIPSSSFPGRHRWKINCYGDERKNSWFCP
jgi:hypothetical protein